MDAVYLGNARKHAARTGDDWTGERVPLFTAALARLCQERGLGGVWNSVSAVLVSKMLCGLARSLVLTAARGVTRGTLRH